MVKEFSPEIRSCDYDSTFSDKKTDLVTLICPRQCNLLCASVQIWTQAIWNLRGWDLKQ